MKHILKNPANPFAMLLMALAMALAFLACEEKGKKAEPDGGEAGNTFTDARDGKKYRLVKIGEQTWMAENLNYAAEGSECDEPPNCDKYGRRYNWETAIKACPSGWHLPSSEEWKVLTDFVGEYPGKKLKATNGWNEYNKASGNGTDEYGFAALPGGGRYSGGNGGVWWRGTNCISMEYNSEYAQEFFCETHNSFSVRCIQGEVSSEEIAMSEAAVAAADSIAAYSSFPDEDRGFGCYTAETGEL